MSKGLIELKVNELSSRIKIIAVASAAGGAVPIPGLSALVDIGLIMREVRFQKDQLQIDDKKISEYKKKFGSEFEDRMNRKLSPAVRAFFVTMDALQPIITREILASEGVELAMDAIPVVGSIVGGTLSAVTTSLALSKALDAHKIIALVTLEIVNELSVEQGLQKKDL